MNDLRKLCFLVLIATFSAHAAAEALDRNQFKKALAAACTVQMGKSDPAGKKAAEDYCQCTTRELLGAVTDADILAALAKKPTPQFAAANEQAKQLCLRTFYATAAVEERKVARFKEISDFPMEGVSRTKSGVFVPAPRENMQVIMDSETGYLVRIGEFGCGWTTAWDKNVSSRESITQLKKEATFVVQAIIGPDAKVVGTEEETVRGYPVLYVEGAATKVNSEGKREDTKLMMAFIMEVTNNAIVSGFCTADAAKYEKAKAALKQVTATATSSRRFTN